MSLTPEAELKEFLRKPKNADDAEPPTLPSHLVNLPHGTYVTAALEYLDDYPFNRPFVALMPMGRPEIFWGEVAFDPNVPKHQGWDEKARSFLKACVEVDRTSLASIDPTYDASLGQQRFIREGLFKRRWTLEELASEIIGLAELIRLETRAASNVATPLTKGEGIDDRVVDKVRMRDEKCQLTGVTREKKRTAEEAVRVRMSGASTARMEVAHGLPFGMADTSFRLVEVLTGLPIRAWGSTVDCVENALMMCNSLHKLFGAFHIYLESDPNDVIYIRARRSPANADPTPVLASIANDERHICDIPFVLIDAPLRPPRLQTIANIDMKFYTLHKFIGDIVWMCGGPEWDDEDEDEEDMKVVSAENWPILKQKLTCI